MKTPLEKFEVDYKKLLAKHPKIHVYGDMSGDPVAHDWSEVKPKSARLPNTHNSKP
jgi:hypothetical protein